MPSDQERLARILDDYLVAIEQGQTVSPEELLARHPEDAEKLRGYLSGLQLFHAAAAGEQLVASGSSPAGVPVALQTIGDYRLVREIGRGGMGVVYEAWQVSLRRRVALKVLPFTSANDAKQIGRFKNEAQAAAQVQHPNIVPVYAVGEESGVHYYVMPLIEGQSLTRLLCAMRGGQDVSGGTTAPNNSLTCDGNRVNKSPSKSASEESHARSTDKSLPMRASETADHIRVVARLGIEAAQALYAAHEYGIVHRDVKPSNLLLDDQGKLWITDFGLARCREAQGFTQSGDVLGTMRYMSPEQALGRTARIDERTDIYSLGLTLYELATLNHPADEISDAQLLFERNRPIIRPLQHWNRHIPADFQTIVLKCLAESPHERYSSARELANDLERFLEGRPILASPPSLASRISKWATRRRGLVYATAAVLLVAAIGTVISGVMLAHERIAANERALRQAREQRNLTSDTFDLFATTYSEKLSTIPGTEPIRQEMLQDAIGWAETLKAQTASDSTFAVELAANAENKLGMWNEMLHKRQEALDAYTAAIHRWEDLIAREPQNPEHVSRLVATLNSLALLISAEGRFDEATDMLRKAQGLQEKLLENGSESTKYAGQLGTTHANLALVLMQTSNKGAAIAELRAAAALLQPLEAKSTDVDTLRSLAACYNNFASLQEATNAKIATEAYRRAIAVQKKLVDAFPTNRLYRAEMARAHSNLGIVSSRNSDWKNAEICYQDAIQLQEDLVKTSPLVASYRRDLAISYNNLGRALARGNRFVEADASFQKAVKSQEALLAAQPNDVQTLSNQGSVWNNLAQSRDRQESYGDAETAYKQAVHFQSEALRRAHNKDAIRALLSKHYFNYADSLAAEERYADAVNVTLERKKLWTGQPERLFAVAQELAGLYRQISRTPGNDAAKTACVEAAAETLRQAVAAGLSRDRLKDSTLSSLNASPDFRQLMDDSRVGTTSTGKTQPSAEQIN